MEDMFEMDVMKIESEDVDCFHLAHEWGRWYAVVDTVMNLWVP
jgi:hypothetical protein